MELFPNDLTGKGTAIDLVIAYLILFIQTSLDCHPMFRFTR